jgi:Tfp pilus assembly protein PilP
MTTLVLSIGLLTTGVLAQSPAPSTVASVAATVRPPTGATGAAATPAIQAPALEPQGYTYNPDSRRDPFVSLMRRGADTQRVAAATRPAGLAGLSSGEITLKGVVASRTGYVAMVQGADNKTYVVHAGETLLDGTIRTITANAIVILQQVNDPLSLQKQREVRKSLRETEEAR